MRYQVNISVQHAPQKELVSEAYLLFPHCDFPAFCRKVFSGKQFCGKEFLWKRISLKTVE